jgi:hypothetical protein
VLTFIIANDMIAIVLEGNKGEAESAYHLIASILLNLFNIALLVAYFVLYFSFIFLLKT